MILLAPDSFKGSLSAVDVARAMEAGIRRVRPDADIRAFPMADGGEGTLDAVLAALPGERRATVVTGACFEPVEAGYGVFRIGGETVAVLEAAQVVGITMPLPLPVEGRTTLGLGELVRHCLDQGVRRFMIGLGGSSTNDGGAGLLCALGARLLNTSGAAVAPTPDGLAALAAADLSALDPRLAESQITIMSDVNNPLCGDLGATAIFGPQKGVLAAQVPVIDARLRQLGTLCDAIVGRPVSAAPGAGAAGGLGYALQALGGVFRSGADVVLELFGFEAVLADAEWVLTGEGRSDRQTLLGKVPQAVAALAARRCVPVTLVSGGVDQASLPDLAPHFAGCFSVTFGPTTLEAAIAHAGALVTDCAEQLARLRFA